MGEPPARTPEPCLAKPRTQVPDPLPRALGVLSSCVVLTPALCGTLGTDPSHRPPDTPPQTTEAPAGHTANEATTAAWALQRASVGPRRTPGLLLGASWVTSLAFRCSRVLKSPGLATMHSLGSLAPLGFSHRLFWGSLSPIFKTPSSQQPLITAPVPDNSDTRGLRDGK